MSVFKSWARWVLRDVIHEHDQQLGSAIRDAALLSRENVELLEQRDHTRQHNRSLLTELRRTRRERDGEALARVEAELLNTWRRLASGFELDDQVDADGNVVCHKIKLHGRNEAARLVGKINREALYPAPLEPYMCEHCAVHPLVGRIWHVRHVEPELRGMTTRERSAYYAARPLSQQLPDDVRALLTARLADVSDQADTADEVAEPRRFDQPSPERRLSLDEAMIKVNDEYADALDELGNR